MSRPLFLTCRLTIQVGGRRIEFEKLSLSGGGVAHFPASASKINLMAGQWVEAELTLPDVPGAKLSVPARVIREITRTEEYLGLDFEWAGQSIAQELLGRWIETWGKPVEPNRRKHPRLASASDPRFPRVAIVSKANESVFAAEGPEYAPWEAQVANLSIEGVLVTSASPLALGIVPGDGLNLILETRGSGGVRIETMAGIRRITESVDPVSGQLMRAFGLRFEWIDSEHRKIYRDLIRGMVTE